jgi:hypothetical protein
MPGHDTDSPPARPFAARLARALRDPGFPTVLGVAATLLFCWPFVRTPPLALVDAWLHLFVAWSLAILALALLSRALARPDGEERDG